MTARQKREILKLSGQVVFAEVDGVSIASNGYVVLPMKPFRFDSGDLKPEGMVRLWKRLPGMLKIAKPVEVKEYFRSFQGFGARLTTGEKIDMKYLSMFDGCAMFNSGHAAPILFVRDKAIVGAAMGMRPTWDTLCEKPTLEEILRWAGVAK